MTTRRGSKRGNDEGSIYFDASVNRWCAVVSLGSGKRQKFHGRTRREVAEKLSTALSARDAGVPLPPNRVTVGEFLETWLRDTAKPSVRPATFQSYATIARLHIIPELGRVKLSRLTPQDVQALMNRKLQAGLAPRRVHMIRGVLRQALGRALAWGLVGRNVATLVKPPRAERIEVQPFDPDEARAFLDAIRDHYLEALYSVALACGLRQGEALGLRWDDVDFERGTITVRYALQRIDGAYRLVEPKTRLSRRTIDVPPVAMAALLRHKAKESEKQLALREWPNEWDLVFTSRTGRPLNDSNVTHGFQRALKKAGLRQQRFHDLRHACASLLLVQGVPARVVMDILGHSQITLTLNTYSHVIPSLRRDAAQRMEELLTAPRGAGDEANPAVAADPDAVAPTPEPVAPRLLQNGPSEPSSEGEVGTRYRTRTCDQGIKSPLLYQLS